MQMLPMTPPAKMRLTITEESLRWFPGRISEVPVVGIWRYQRGVLILCWNDADKGFPKRFEETEQQDVATLWMR
jgi:hypothetical protein